MKKKLYIILILISLFGVFFVSNKTYAMKDRNIEESREEYLNYREEDEEFYTEEYKNFMKLSDEEKSKIYALPRKYIVS